MKKIFAVIAVPFFVFALNTAMAKGFNDKIADNLSILGRWDMTISVNGKQLPSWLEVQRSGTNTLVGKFVAAGGSARPVSKINFSDGKISFTIPPQWEQGKNDLSFEGILQGDILTGNMVSSDGKSYNWSALRAPSLMRTAAPAA